MIELMRRFFEASDKDVLIVFAIYVTFVTICTIYYSKHEKEKENEKCDNSNA